MKDLTILFSACGSQVAPGMIDCIKNNGERNVRIVGIDMNYDPSVLQYVDTFYQVPAANTFNYTDVVLNICMKEKVDIYFPNISAEVETLARRKEDFQSLGILLSVSNSDAVSVSNNKLITYQKLKAAGIPVPQFYPVHTVEDFIEGCKVMGFPHKPVCLKIANGSGSRGVRIIDATQSRYQIFVKKKPNSFYTSYEDMLSILQEPNYLDEMMLVEYMPGNEYTVDLLADKGNVLYEVGRENTVSMMSIAQESILTYDKHAYQVCKDVVSLLDMDGNIGFDFMRNSENKAVLMDINPRLTATVSLIAAGGVNLPYLRIKQLLGEELPICDVKYGTRLKRRYKDYFTIVK